MQTQVTFRQMKSNPELRTAAAEATKKFEKFFEDIISTDIIFRNDPLKMVEFTVRVKGDTLVVKEGSEDFLKSLNEGTDKMVRQIRKWKQKIGIK
ncbi:MAG: ribosome-associated translation inhibitor RaiA [bacterium]